MVGTIRCEQCQKAFNDQIVFDQVRLEMKQGEILSLVGPSGTGKSTLLRCIAGLEQLTLGQIYIEGIDVTNLQANKRPVVMMFQQTLLFPHMTVLENVTYGLKMRKVKKKRRNEEGMELLEKVEMAKYANYYPYECSGGQQQRIALARALITKPKLLLLDEPFSSLDTDLRSSIRDWVRRLLKEEEITAIFVTHDKEESMIMGDLVAVMERKRFNK
jgi:ABC-type Fe3+/spermidine/putrescine transport system ATPase subunit